MINKLAFRNAKRSIKDYLVYLITMVVISSLMFAFNSMIFSKDILKLCSMAGIMAAMIGLATVFIIIVLSWLINYMIKFMMNKKSREFGIYLILGISKKQIMSLFMKENIIIGSLGFLLGILPGMFLQQIFTTIFYTVFSQEYILKIEFSLYGFLLTFVLYLVIYITSLLRNKRKIKKITIKNMMDMEKKNENYMNNHVKIKTVLFFVSILYFIIFDVMLLKNMYTIKSIWIFLGLLIVAIYLFYMGISAFIQIYLGKNKKNIYKNDKLFLLRQISSKINTMEFTMSTLTILFVFSILSGTIAMMFNDYINKRLDYQIPFDISIFSDNTKDNFKPYMNIIEKNCKVKDKLIYNIYENKSDNVNMYLRKKLNYPKTDDYKDNDDSAYFDYDTYMKLSDYNKLRKILGYKEVNLPKNEFLIHSKNNVKTYLQNYFENKNINISGNKLSCEGFYTEGFSQRGQNGADYIIVAPDKIIEEMTPYYSLLVVDIEKDAPKELQDKLSKVKNYYDENDNFKCNIIWGHGSEEIIDCTDTVLVRSNCIQEIKFMLTSISFPFIYIALIFICVGLTILSIQQISDSSKYKFRYNILGKLGLNNRQIDKIILKQLLIYYLLPLIISICISCVLGLYISHKFIYYTGIGTSLFLYLPLSLCILLSVYTIYFIVTYVNFKRNIHSEI